MNISPEVKNAILQGKPVVALESTIISHGMPWPQNVETAKEVEAVVRQHGAIPATIAILKGVPTIGLTDIELEYVGKTPNVAKVSRRDLPYILSQKLDGATTVASTMILAEKAGIKIFATGGIGGVHRGAETTFDISADLTELSKTNVAVVCAGVKSILDIGLTLEYLETQGVPVVGFGTMDFPAFYTQKSGFRADFRLNTPREVAEMLQEKWIFGLKGGAIIANPIPDEFAMPQEEIDQAIAAALQEANTKGIKGKDVTPFLLSKIKELTAGRSLASNIALIKNNAKVAAQIAVEYFNRIVI